MPSLVSRAQGTLSRKQKKLLKAANAAQKRANERETEERKANGGVKALTQTAF